MKPSWRRAVVGALAAAVCAFLLPLGGVAQAAVPAPAVPDLGASIDPLQPWDPTEGTGCSSTITPGILAIRDVISATYATNRVFDILRTCSTAYHSGHEEGRAIDWMVDSRVPAQEALAQSFISWLLATDKYGNQFAMARRLGVMYLIHNNWGWRAYDVNNHTNPSTDPHIDHIHISLAWPGARAQTSYYTGGYGCLPGTLGCPVTRLAGADRYATAVAIARAAVPTSSSVVIASGEQAHLVDGLVGAPLAAVKHAPLLLTTAISLPAAVAAEITRRGATTAYVLGGEGVIGSAVVDQLTALGVTTVTRLWGADRYATAAAIADQVGSPSRTAFVASGWDSELSNALMAGGPAAALGVPVILTRTDVISSSAADEIAKLGVTRTYTVGGTGTIAAAVFAALPAVTKVEGVGSYATSVALATAMAGLVPTAHVVVASGATANTVDGLPGGVLGQVLLLTTPTSLSDVVRTWLRAHPLVVGVTVLGGPSAVTDFTARMTALSVTATP